MEGERINLENNGNCLFCKVTPVVFNPVTFYSVRTLLEYLQISQVEVEVKAEEGVEQPAQSITVDLNGSEVNAGLCKGCGDLVNRFLRLKTMMEMSMEVCLVSIQMKMEVGSEGGRMEYPAREGIIMKRALKNLKRTEPRLCSQNLQVPEMSSAPANEPLEVVKVEVNEDEVEATQDSDSVPGIQRKMPVKLSKERGQMRQKRVIGVGQRKNARQVRKAKAPAYDKRVLGREENGEHGMKTTQTTDSVPVISEIVKTDCLSLTVTPRKRRHTRVMKFQCSKCENKFSNQSHLLLHLAIHNGERPWVCRTCKKTFQRKGNLRLHRLLHSKPVTCDACQKQFRNHADLRMHKKTSRLSFQKRT